MEQQATDTTTEPVQEKRMRVTQENSYMPQLKSAMRNKDSTASCGPILKKPIIKENI